MSAREFLDDLRHLGVQVVADGGALRCRAPVGTLTDELKERLREHKAQLLAALLDSDSLRAIEEKRAVWGDGPCRTCDGTLFWHRRGGPLVCVTCHPPAVPGIVYRRVQLELAEDPIERVN